MSFHEYEAPLATNDEEDWADFGDFDAAASSQIQADPMQQEKGVSREGTKSDKASLDEDVFNSNGPDASKSDLDAIDNPHREQMMTKKEVALSSSASFGTTKYMSKNTSKGQTTIIRNDNDFDDNNFNDTFCFSGSLEDLVHSFDEKITNCFPDLDNEGDESVDPVHIRSHEELLSENE